MSLTGSEKENTEKLAAMWMYATHMGSLPPPSVRKMTPPSRPIVLIPASSNGSTMESPHQMQMAPPPGAMMLPPMMPYARNMTLPYMRHPNGSVIYAAPHGSMPGTFRPQKNASKKSAMHAGHGHQQQQQRRRRGAAGQMPRAGKMDPNRRQRRKSEADVLDGQAVQAQAQAFQYHGLDRAIADNFLARQEQSNTGSSHLDYSSSTSSSSAASEHYGQAASRASSKTKIVCRDVVM